MRYVRKLQVASNDNIYHVIYVDQANGNDGNIGIDDETKPAKTLQKAIDALVNINEPCEVRIVSDYTINGLERIIKVTSNKVVVTCANGAVITGLATSPTTTIEPKFIKVGSTYKELASTCDELDAEHYFDFSAKSFSNQNYTGSDNSYTQDVVMSIPNGYTVTTGMMIDARVAWVNARGPITAVDNTNHTMTVSLNTQNFKFYATTVGKYRIQNYGNATTNTFKYTKNNDSYQISGNTANVKTLQPSSLTIYNTFNLVFKNCKFESIYNNNNSINVQSSYAIRFESCSFEYCEKITGGNNEDVVFNDSYFYKSNYSIQAKHSYVRNSLFKRSTIAAIYGIVIEHNEICYNLQAIGGGISRKNTVDGRVYDKILIQNNEIHHIGGFLQGDYAAIYHYGQCEAVIQYNYIHDCIGRKAITGLFFGVYCDEGAYGMLVRYNMIVNCTVNSHTHFSRGCVFYNNLFAYPAVEQFRYARVCYEGGTSYIANIFHKGSILPERLQNLIDDGAMFQFNIIDTVLPLEETSNVHSNEIGIVPFTNPAASDFSIPNHRYQIGRITMGSSDIRNFNQSMIDTSFFEQTTNTSGAVLHPYGLPADSQWQSKRGFTVKFTNDYDKWFIQQEMNIYGITNEYLQNKIG